MKYTMIHLVMDSVVVKVRIIDFIVNASRCRFECPKAQLDSRMPRTAATSESGKNIRLILTLFEGSNIISDCIKAPYPRK